jgi:hypothetical protein
MVNNKMFGLMFVMILLLGSVNAFEFAELDDVKVYDEDSRTYSLDNFFGLGRHIAEVELKSPQVYKVGVGYQKVAEMEVRNGDGNVENIINEMELYDIKDDMSAFDRQVDYKYKVLTEVTDYETICTYLNSSLEAGCSQVETGTRIEESWQDFDSNSLLINETITLGVFTTTYEGEHVEWIINMYGNERLVEWAEWDAGLEVNLVSYYKLDEITGTSVTDSYGSNTATANDAAVFTSEIVGRINTGVDFTGNNNISITTSPFAGYTAFSVSFWTDVNWANSASWAVFAGSVSDGSYDWMVRKDGANTGFAALITTDSDASNLQMGAGLSNGLYHFVMTWNGTGTTLFLNNTARVTDSTLAGTMTDTSKIFSVGRGTLTLDTRTMENMMDELVIWDRALTLTEINQLYNSGLGISISIDNNVSVVLNSPVDTFNSTSQTVIFNATVSDDQKVENVSLYLDGVLNETNTSSLNNSFYTFTKTFADGSYNWSILAWDNSSQNNVSQTRDFSVDSTLPVFNVTHPYPNLTYLEVLRGNVSINWTYTENNIDSCWYNYNGTNISVTSCNDNYTTLEILMSDSDLSLWMNDTSGNLAYKNVTWGISNSTITFRVINYLTSLVSSVQFSNAFSYTGNPYTVDLSDFINESQKVVNLSINIDDLGDTNQDKNFTTNINTSYIVYNLSLSPNQLLLNFVNSTGGAQSNIYDVFYPATTGYTVYCNESSNLTLIGNNMTTGRVSVRINAPQCGVNWTQFYEYNNDGKVHLTENITLLNNPDWTVYFQVKSKSGSNIKDAVLRFEQTDSSSGSYSTVDLISQRLSNDDGTTFARLNSSSYTLLTVSASGYDLKTIPLITGDITSTQAIPYPIILEESDAGIAYNVWVSYPKWISNKSKNIQGVITAKSADQVKLQTTYMASARELTQPKGNGVYNATLVSGTDFNSVNGSGSISINIIIDGYSIKNWTIEEKVANRFFDLPSDFSEDTLVTIGSIALIVVSSIAGMVLTSVTAGFTVFMVGSILLLLVSTSFFWLAVIGLMYFVLKAIRRTTQG